MENAPLILTVASGLIVLFAILRAVKARGRQVEGVPFGKRFEVALPALANLVGGGLIAAAIYTGAKLFFKEPVLGSFHLLAIAIVAASAVEFIAALAFPVSEELKGSRLIAPVIAVVVAGGVFGFAVHLGSVPGGSAAALALAYPVRGSWEVVAGGPTAYTNYHHNHPAAQNYAVDLVKVQGETEGETVYAPVDSVVAEAVGDREQGSEEPEGNVIILKTDSGTDIWLAHLRQGSVTVKKGDRVTQGQAIAQCGSTGNTAKPHLHIHAERNGQAVPMVFGRGKRFLLRNDRIVSGDGN